MIYQSILDYLQLLSYFYLFIIQIYLDLIKKIMFFLDFQLQKQKDDLIFIFNYLLLAFLHPYLLFLLHEIYLFLN